MSARHTMTSLPVWLEKNALPTAKGRFTLNARMATLSDFLTACALQPSGIRSHAGGICRLCNMKVSGLITKDHDFQLWIEERLALSILNDLVAGMNSSPPPLTRLDAIDMLAKPLKNAKLTGPQVEPDHLPVRVARAIDAKPIRDLVDRNRVDAGHDPADRRTPIVTRKSLSSEEALEMALARRFDEIIRSGDQTVWVGWHSHMKPDEFVAHVKSTIATVADADQWFALGWDTTIMTGPNPGYLFIFRPPTQADLRVPTLADAIDPSDNLKHWDARWHSLFLPTPADWPTGAIRRDRSIVEAIKQWHSRAFDRSEAIFKPVGGHVSVDFDYIPLKAA